MSALRSAQKNRQRPTSMILHDPYALHRKWWDWTWEPGIGDDSWTDWDYILADVFQTIEDYTDPESGQFMPFDQSGDVHWDVLSRISGASEALDKARSERGELKPGESLYAVPVFGETKPTLESWARDLQEEKTNRPSSVREARPPTAAELAKLASAVD